jgi:predicted naringenin-chalcone synthase
MIVIKDFKIIRPRFEHPQHLLLEWLASQHAHAEQLQQGGASEQGQDLKKTYLRYFQRYGCSPENIAFRSTDVPEVGGLAVSEFGIYKLSRENPSGADITARMNLFSQTTLDVFREFYPEATRAPDHLFHVTCSGYVSPSAAQILVSERKWGEDSVVGISHAYHMGCYSALPTVRLGAAVLQSLSKILQPQVDIVHTEMCTLHMNPADHSAQQLVIQSLFADGHIKYSVGFESKAQQAGVPGQKRVLEVLTIHERVLPGSVDAMTWQPAAWGFQMTLSREIPRLIAQNLQDFVQRVFENAGYPGLACSEGVKGVVFVIHPGGPKIIESIQDVLKLEQWQVAHSKEVLRDCGNMSSATVPHIWERIGNDGSLEEGTMIMTLAFGPGITIFGALLRLVSGGG